MKTWHKFPLARIEYVPDGSMAAGKAGSCHAFFIRIAESYRGDEGLKQHELAHAGMFWRTLGLHLLLKRIERYDIWNEARAYRIQQRFPDRHGNYLLPQDAAQRMLSDIYGFSLTYDEALALVMKR